MIDKQPTNCNLCGGKVVFTSNARIYGKEYGSGKCYYCTSCGAIVGTHIPRPTEALGILSNAPMRAAKKKCHALFDIHWKDAKRRGASRTAMYHWLAKQMKMDPAECHFGNFTLDQLKQAYAILLTVKDSKMRLSKKGRAVFTSEKRGAA